MHIDIGNIQTYSMEHLQNWLIYRGDILKGIANLKDAQVKFPQYFSTEHKLHDPTSSKIWLPQNKQLMRITLKK